MSAFENGAGCERGGLVVDDVVRGVDAEVFDVGVGAGPVGPVDVGAEAEVGELVRGCGCFPVPFCGGLGILEILAYDGWMELIVDVRDGERDGVPPPFWLIANQ